MSKAKSEKKKCGIIMPIAEHTDYPKNHWQDVLGIIMEAVRTTSFEPRLVSDDVAIGLIHDRIVTNIYNDEIVICDVSSKNPNVMFELGMRLAFDKPTIIIKDEKTGYSFDTGVIEHIPYPSSLRFHEIVDFKKELSERVSATYEKSVSESDFSPFLRTFGQKIVPAQINQTEIPESKYIIEQLQNLRSDVQSLKSQYTIDNWNAHVRPKKDSFDLYFDTINNQLNEEKLNNLKKILDTYKFQDKAKDIKREKSSKDKDSEEK